MNNNQTFTPEQDVALQELFEKFYDLSHKVVSTAKITKMALIAQDYTDYKLNDNEVDLAFENILNDMKYIIGECVELSCNPNYLFWDEKCKNQY